MKIGFIGLGRMGKGMARRILETEHDVAVYRAGCELAAEFTAAGARVASSFADVCGGCDIAITMLAQDRTVTDVVLGAGGICDSLPVGPIHLAMGTHGAATVRALVDAHTQARQSLVAA